MARAGSGNCFSRMCPNSLQTILQALCGEREGQTGAQLDRATTYGRQRVPSEIPPADIDRMKLTAEMY